MCQYQVFSENEWIYPDTVITSKNQSTLFAARGSDVCFQVLTDYQLEKGDEICFSFACDGCCADVMQLLPATVVYNSSATYGVAEDYESVKHFVTRKAPFDVYDVTKPLDDGPTEPGRAAFSVRVNVASDAPTGCFECVLSIWFRGITLEIPVSLKIYRTVIPALKDATFHMTNWIHFRQFRRRVSLADLYHVEEWTDRYVEILKEHLKNLVDMRNDFLMLPAGEPIYSEDGTVVDFDFSRVELVGNLALEYGFTTVMGGFPAEWIEWDKPELYLCWDSEIEVTSIEGYRQLKIYFTRAWELVQKNGWESCYMQCLVDEPQFQSAAAYRALSGICRKCMPGIQINDPVETTDIAGALDIWVVKQAIYDSYREDFQRLQAMGEKIWIYTCGFPAGPTMNRVMDLPLTVSRLPFWMCHGYGATGFLHFGYDLHNPINQVRDNVNFQKPGARPFPPGNSFIIYPGNGKPWYSVRGHLQRLGTYDCELLNMLAKQNPGASKELVHQLCRSFDDYDPSARMLDSVRTKLLEYLG